MSSLVSVTYRFDWICKDEQEAAIMRDSLVKLSDYVYLGLEKEWMHPDRFGIYHKIGLKVKRISEHSNLAVAT